MSLKFVSAAYQNNQFSNIGIYIKYGNYNKFQIVTDSPSHTHLITPDRELYIHGDTFGDNVNPLVLDFDEYIDLNILGKNYSKNFIGQYMINFTDSIGKEQSFHKKQNSGSVVFCDSGGFQIAMGRCTIINPIELIKFYNDNVDLGMVLDIPDYNEGNPFPDEMIADLALIQKRNNDYMLKYKNNRVELINIIHGSTVKQKLDYLESVHSDEIQRLALPSVGIPMSLKRLDLIISLCKKAKELGHYKHFHILGSFNKGIIYTMAKLAHSKIPEVEGIDFTMDASSPLQTAVNLTYYKSLNMWEGFDEFSPLPKEKFRHIDYNISLYKDNFGKFNKYSLLPCNCPICSALKYSYVLRNIQGGTLRNQIFLNHNSLEANNFVDMVDTFAVNLSDKEYLQYIKRVQDSDCTDVILCLKYIKHIEKVGFEQAQKDFSNYLREDNITKKSSGFLTSVKSEEVRKLSDWLQDLISQYKSIDFEHYEGKLKLGKGVRSAITMKKEV